MPDSLSTLLQALHVDPADATAWLALADALEEGGEPDRAELVRLSRALNTLTLDETRSRTERRLRELLARGVEPCMPEITNSIGMRLALIPPGEFWMGSPPEELNRYPDEGPRHEVTITRPFYLGVFTVTQSEYESVVGSNPAHFSRSGAGARQVRGLDSGRFPVERVSWEDAVSFCGRLSEMAPEKKAGRVYRLPTEAEWEYACRAGTTTVFHFGNDLCSADANFDGNQPYGQWDKGTYLGRPCVVGSYRPNAFGLYDMHGNVWEWCADWYDRETYRVGPPRDPRGPDEGGHRILRGGCWRNEGFYLRSAHRGWSTPDERIGFRVVLEHGAARPVRP